ncbi:RNA-binding protein 44 [Tenrec ecaudatus]|uniref:RNA-binding protein 44 n=1 Tax=Tenrec ecaudatus TaxID=94439 RepID=UPI003F5A44EE
MLGSSEKEKCCKDVRCPVPDGDGDSRRGDGAHAKELSNPERVDYLEHPCGGSEGTNGESAHSQSSEFEDSIEYAFLNETYSIHYSDAKLRAESPIQVNSELKSETQKGETVPFDILEQQGIKSRGLDQIYRIAGDACKESAEGEPKNDLEEDSQQEYHSAEEQEYLDNHLSFDQSEILNIPNLELPGSKHLGYEASIQEDNQFELGTSSVISLDSMDACGQGDVSQFQTSDMLREYHERKHGKCSEQETSLRYHSLLDEMILTGCSLQEHESQPKGVFLSPSEAPAAKTYTGKMKAQVAESGDCRTRVVEKNLYQHLEDPSALPQEAALEMLLQPCKERQHAWDAVISASGYPNYRGQQSTSDPAFDLSAALPRITPKDKRSVEDTSQNIADSSGPGKMCSHTVEGTCPASLMESALLMDSAVTVTQMVDASTDFRACFTTSRATSARPSVASVSSNTEITMMNKKRPGEWQSEKPRSVACNTDWSFSQDGVDAQLAVLTGPGKLPSADGVKPSGRFLHKDSLELRKTLEITDLKNYPERYVRGEMENLALQCCQKVMQRALSAELHLLDAHYQMCHHHCWDLYRLVMSEKEGAHRNLTSHSAKKELGSALLSVLGDIKARYESLKEKISKGKPLEELPPLSIESKLLSALSAFAAALMKEETLVFPGTASEPQNQNVPDDASSDLQEARSQVSVVSENRQPRQDAVAQKEASNHVDIIEDFSHMKLNDPDCRSYQEISDDWFDAKDNLTGVDVSRIQGNQIEQDRWTSKFTPAERKSTEASCREKAYLIHVGGLCPSVSEADLKSLFQKYQVSEISIYDSSTNYRYASLAFKKNSNAKTAVKEMNGAEIHGKPASVRLVKTPGECTAPLPSRNGGRSSVNSAERSTSKETNPATCVSRLPRTRPRQLGPEPDSEFFPFDQKGVKKNCKEMELPMSLPDVPTLFMPPHTLNLRSFTKIMKRLAELHPEVDRHRDRIVAALQEVRLSRKGFLSGLSVNTIVELTSSVLKNSASI